MNKYELALVVSANVDEEVRNATVEQVKELITRFGGTITDPGTCVLQQALDALNPNDPEVTKLTAELKCPPSAVALRHAFGMAVRIGQAFKLQQDP